MGAVGAEARGLVRQDLARVLVRDGQTVARRVSAFMEAKSARFDAGKRISAVEVEAVRQFVEQTPVVTMREMGRVFYPQARMLSTHNELKDATFNEVCLEIRALKPDVSRRRLGFWDYTLGVEFTAHALGRIVERDERRSGIAEHVLSQTIEAICFLSLLLRSPSSSSTFVAPFADGLILGQFASLDGIAPAEQFATDRTGCGYEPPQFRTVWEDEAGHTHGFRVATYLCRDALRPQQEGVIEEWRRVVSECHDVLSLITLGAMAPEFKNDPELLPHLDRVVASFSRFLASDAWRATTEAADFAG